MTAVEANPVFVGRIVDHGPTWKWFQFDMLRMELRAGDRLRVSCAQFSPLRFGEILVIGVIDNLVYLSGSAFDGIAAIADHDYVYLVGRAEDRSAAPDATFAAAQDAALQGGIGSPAWDRYIRGDLLAARLKMAGEMAIDHEAARKAFGFPPAPAPKPADPYTCCGERMLHYPTLDQVSCSKCLRIVTGMEMSALASQRKAVQPADPLDVEYDGIDLRWLLERDRNLRREAGGWCGRFAPAQRAAVSTHWSAELRAKVAAVKERERNVVRVDLDDDAC